MWPSADALPSPLRSETLFVASFEAAIRRRKWSCERRCAQGLAHAMARELGVNRKTVILWRKRFAQSGLDGLAIGRAPDANRRSPLNSSNASSIQRFTRSPGGHALEHPHPRQALGRLQDGHPADHGLQPHRLETFKLSRDKQFVEKLRDVVGLYLNPPEHALVLSVDEKSQIQALDRSQPGLPLKKGRAGTMTHDFKRHGTTTLFAAFNVLDGQVIGECLPRHRHQEFLKFLRKIDRETPPALELHLIVDNYSTHKHEQVKKWLAKHPRFHFHFIPTSSSWLNLVERWFRELTQKRIRRGVFRSVPELEAAIHDINNLQRRCALTRFLSHRSNPHFSPPDGRSTR